MQLFYVVSLHRLFRTTKYTEDPAEQEKSVTASSQYPWNQYRLSRLSAPLVETCVAASSLRRRPIAAGMAPA